MNMTQDKFNNEMNKRLTQTEEKMYDGNQVVRVVSKYKKHNAYNIGDGIGEVFLFNAGIDAYYDNMQGVSNAY